MFALRILVKIIIVCIIRAFDATPEEVDIFQVLRGKFLSGVIRFSQSIQFKLAP